MTARPQVYDCFTFSTELDVLELRLELLDPVVDHVVLVEATRTHSGAPKALHFAENRARFAAYGDKIIHVVVEDLPSPEPDRWVPERFQRECIVRGLDGAAPDDLVIVADVDEIPDPDIIARLRDTPFDVATLELRACFYRANWELPEPWPLTRIARRELVKSAQDLRDQEPLLRVGEAGVHLSYLMDVPAIGAKYRNFAHAELDNEKASNPDFLDLMQRVRVFAPRLAPLRVRDEDELHPVQRWLLQTRPDLFEFGVPSSLVRRCAVGWGRLRSRRRMPMGLVARGDLLAHRLVAERRPRVGQHSPARARVLERETT